MCSSLHNKFPHNEKCESQQLIIILLLSISLLYYSIITTPNPCQSRASLIGLALFSVQSRVDMFATGGKALFSCFVPVVSQSAVMILHFKVQRRK